MRRRAARGAASGVKGDEWQVHGGGFYHMMKYLVAGEAQFRDWPLGLNLGQVATHLNQVRLSGICAGQ
jgi:uncharacterized membrane protein